MLDVAHVWWLALAMISAVILAEDTQFFHNTLSWDGIIAAIGLGLTIIFSIGLAGWRWWRPRHPLKVTFSLDEYDDRTSEITESRKTPFWEAGASSDIRFLLKISPHDGAVFRRVRLRLVERKWFSGLNLWSWRPVDRQVARLTAMVDMRYHCSASPLYYWEADFEEPEGSFMGLYFNDHDPARGVDIPAGSSLWIGVVMFALVEWRGRIEIDTDVAGKRIYERKRLHIDNDGPVEKAFYSFGPTMKPFYIALDLPSEKETATPIPRSTPDKAGSQTE